MTDHELTYAKMARQVYRELTDQRPQWEARSPQMLADFEQLALHLQAFDEIAHRQGGKETHGEYPDVADRAEQAAEAAAGRIVRGLRVLQLHVKNPALEKAAGFTPDQLNPLHGDDLLAALQTIAAAGATAAGQLAHEGVTAEHLQALDDAIAAYTPLADLNRSRSASQGEKLGDSARQIGKALRGLLQRLDTRLDNLRDDLPGLAQRYDEARRADPNYVPGAAVGLGRQDGGDGSEGGIGREAAGTASGPQAAPFGG